MPSILETTRPVFADSGLDVAVVGATGAVGTELLKLFESRAFPVRRLRLLASERSAGRLLTYRGREIAVESLAASAFKGIDLAFFSAGASRSRKFVPAALDAGALVVDNSSAFRMNENVPLVVPEINGDSIHPENSLIAVPNCSAIILLMAVYPLTQIGKVNRLIVSTYQSASGGGAGMMQRLLDETRQHLEGAPTAESGSVQPYAFNLFSHNTKVNEDGLNEEEAKVIAESRKILGRSDLRVNVTCIRVPVLRAHSESVTVEFEGEAPSEVRVREALGAMPGVRVIDDRESNQFPTPILASGQGDVLVGRIRRDPSHDSAISMFVSGDQLLKGAALNAVQIAELAMPMRRVRVAD